MIEITSNTPTPDDTITSLQNAILHLLELSGIPPAINDQIMKLVEKGEEWKRSEARWVDILANNEFEALIQKQRERMKARREQKP